MKIVVLSRKQKSYFTDRLLEEANSYASGPDIEIIDPYHCQLIIDNNTYQIFYKGKPINDVDLVIPRITSSYLDYSIGVIRYFEKAGFRTLNNSEVIKKTKNKFETLQNLQELPNIKIPRSVLIKSPKDLETAVNIIGSLPVVLKMTSSENRSIGSILVNNLKYAESFLDINFMLDNFTQIGQNIIVQEFIRESLGRAFNYIILGNNVIGSCISKRTIINNIVFNDICSEISDNKKVSEEGENLALQVAKEFGMDFGVISMLESGSGLVILEVNPFPDTEELEKVYKIDIFSKLLRYFVCDTRVV